MGTLEKPKEDSTDGHRERQDEVFQLIEWVDKNEKKLVRWRDAFYHLGWLILVMIIVVVAIPSVFIFTDSTTTERLVTLLSIVALLIAFLSMVTSISERNVVEARMKHALKMRKFTETEKPLLKALIKIKSKNPETKLATLYAMDRESKGDSFTKKKLLEILVQ